MCLVHRSRAAGDQSRRLVICCTAGGRLPELQAAASALKFSRSLQLTALREIVAALRSARRELSIDISNYILSADRSQITLLPGIRQGPRPELEPLLENAARSRR